MKFNQPITYGIVGFFVGILIASMFVPNRNIVNETSKSQPTSVPSNMHVMPNGAAMTNEEGHLSMRGMVEALEGKTGDAFDKEFIRLMIEHHQGAIEMAKEAKKNAGHEEIKKLSDEIISAQTAEIEQMKAWWEHWGY